MLMTQSAIHPSQSEQTYAQQANPPERALDFVLRYTSTYAAASAAANDASTTSTATHHTTAHQQQQAYADQRSRSLSASMNGYASGAAQPAMYVRALYDYDADDRTSLSFHEGDVIQVINQLESGWWDGVINGVRGWFPSNYCQVITADEALASRHQPEHIEDLDDDEGTDEYEDQYEDDAESDADDFDTSLPVEGVTHTQKTGADYWVPQATPDGRLFYYNTLTGEISSELPLESPTSATENGPRDRMYVNVPEKTRPPPEMMARGYMQDEDDSDANSQSELEGESLMFASRGSVSQRRRSYISDGISPAPSMDSMNGSMSASRSRGTSVSNTGAPILASSMSTTNSSYQNNYPGTVPRSFFDDGPAAPLTWHRLVSNMQQALERYREAITNGDRSEYVRRAEDISDHLRLLLAAGSGTTDNHSGQPSIISANRALYPHFRDTMSKFSKLVISSHIAAADWPTPESYQKCLQEADGVLQGVLSYVEVARAQRGEEIPRLLPGFVIGSTNGGSWQNNNLGGRDPMSSNFLDEDETLVEPNVPLDAKLSERLDDLKRMLISSIRKLEEHLVITDKIITPYKHEIIANNVCTACSKVLEMFKPWVAIIESINLAPLGTTFQNPQLADFAIYKQNLYDNMSDLILSCQTVAGPLGDEWVEVRGDPLETRMNSVRQCARQLENTSSHIGFSLQLLGEQVQMSVQEDPRAREELRQPLRRENTMPYTVHQRSDSRQMGPGPVAGSGSSAATNLRPGLPTLGQSQSFSEGIDPVTTNYRKAGENSKVKKFFGEEPIPPGGRMPQQEETPEYLQLDYEADISYDNKVSPPSLKGGTLLALVEQLTRHDKLDSNFKDTFLLTYRSFTTARELFEMLVLRFQIQPPEGMVQADYDVWRDRKQKPIRFRVVNILKSWLDNYWMEDMNDPATKQLLRDIHTFASDTVRTTETPGSAPLLAVLDQRLKGQDATAKRLVPSNNQNTPMPIMPKNMKKLKFLDIDVTEFARQLTIIESKLYGKIKPTECLNKTWTRKVPEGEADPAPNVRALITHSNQLTNWVAEMILTQLDVKKRVVVIKHFVSVADKCRALNNYSTLTSIISALGASPIHRLKRTWDQVPARTTAVLEQMRKLMNSTRNFGEYRESLHLANPPCIPFFGVYLTDLTFIEEGIPSVIKKSSLINFNKRVKTAEVIRDIQQYQNVPYPLQPVPELQEYILSNMQAASDVSTMYDKSLAVEPREREDEKIVRVLAESGFL